MDAPSPAAIEAQRAYAALQAEVRRRKYLTDPVLWASEVLGDKLWSKQREIMESVRDNRLTAVPSCHGSGKSFTASRIACWWIASHAPGEAVVVTTASTWKQVEVVLWKEIRRAHVRGHLPGRTNRTEWLMTIPGSDEAEEIVAFGHRPADTDPTAFQGIHAPYVLVIFDEATGVPKMLWDSADSLISNEDSRFLAIGNPDDPLSEFANVCTKKDTDWNVIPISAFDTPNFTEEPGISEEVRRTNLVSKIWVAEKLKRWGSTNHPLYQSKVLGRFPEYAEDGLIPIKWIRDAQARWEDTPKGAPCEMGIDVGGGTDKNIICVRNGMRASIVAEDSQPDTMKTANNVRRYMRMYAPSTARIDAIGIGRGASDRLKEWKLPITAVQVSEQAAEPDQFINQRAEFYWHLRTQFQNEAIAIDPADEDLEAQLMNIRYITPSGRIQIESKDQYKRRNSDQSPDRADALMLAYAPTGVRKRAKATWGTGRLAGRAGGRPLASQGGRR